MNKQLALIPLFALALVGCDQPNKNVPNAKNPSQVSVQDVDNTGRNVRDRDGVLPTSGDQSETEVDRQISKKIREAIVGEDSLSTNAKNVKIITINGVVTLRGPVASENEKDLVGKKAAKVAGVSRVDNQLEILINNKK